MDRTALPWWRRPRVWAAAALAVAGIALAVGWAVSRPSSPPAPSPGPSRSSSPTPDDLTGIDAPPPEETLPPLTRETPYCEAFRTIIAGGSGASGEEGKTLEDLSRTYAELRTKYESAGRLAPGSLSDDYAAVVTYLKEAKAAVDSGDFARIRAKFGELENLNTVMAAIDEESRRICA